MNLIISLVNLVLIVDLIQSLIVVDLKPTIDLESEFDSVIDYYNDWHNPSAVYLVN